MSEPNELWRRATEDEGGPEAEGHALRARAVPEEAEDAVEGGAAEAEGHWFRTRAVPEDAGAGQGGEGGEGPEAEGHGLSRR